MKSLANAIAALLLAALWCIAGTCTPKPPTASPIAVPALIPEAATPKPDDDGAGDLSQPQPTSTNLVAEAAPPLIDLPPDAGAEPDAGFIAPVVEPVETHAPVACATCAPAAATYRPVRQPVYQPVYQRPARRGLFNGRFRR